MNVRTKKAKPVNHESEFGIDEIFFSTTDLTGNITSGNSVFVRVSQYNKNELVGAAHNIIRHPDMPKLVFKVLWDYLKADKPVAAYVKNMTKEGRYYWVLASAFPIPNGYLSIRIKPSTEILKLMPDIYAQLLVTEESSGMEGSLKQLLGILKSKGFDDYDSFMSTILVAELNAREEALKARVKTIAHVHPSQKTYAPKNPQQEMIALLKEIKSICNAITGSFDALFHDFGNLLNADKTLKTASASILEFSTKVSILSLNAKLNSNFEGENGRTLTVVANTISTNKSNIESYTKAIVTCSKEISTYTQKLGFQTSILRLQSTMINFFIQELYDQSLHKDIPPSELIDMKKNILALIELFMRSFAQLTSLIVPIKEHMHRVLELINLINKSIYELELCNFLGKMEAAKIGKNGAKFNTTFAEIKECSAKIKESLLDELCRYLDGGIATTTAITAMNAQILDHVVAIKSAVDKL